ncbi:angiogenic factor with G patch and FHA domains 1 isoform X2 [Leptinotarsa decemlineata]|uniref:angiogenic factor with G patch and FHA domains 1 isoform X2 n=1 Tax=Leptinotarsa decemlineata TaxID=7539 RepID=UPI003D3046FB
MTDKADIPRDAKFSCEDLFQADSDFKYKSEIDPDLKETLKDIPGALEYIQKLEKLIVKHLKKIVKLKNKLKKTDKLVDVFTQTDFEADTEYTVCNSDVGTEMPVGEPKSLADDIKDAAEMAMKNTGFVYEETSGMYYDYNTGYYYNAEYGLYYDGSTGTYLNYNQDTKSYEFHSQVSLQPAEQKPTRRKKRKNKNGSRNKVKSSSDLEDLENSFNNMSINNLRSIALDISKQWPPCMRVIVESTDSSKLKEGSLHIITFEGGTLGREGSHSILVPDASASKHHLKITFDKDTGLFYVVDLGSRNGTLLNGKRISPSKQESEPIAVEHGSRLQIGSTVFLCHVHEGSQTCGHCEPGLIQAKVPEKEIVTTISRSERHKNELKNLKMKCGVGAEYGEDPKLAAGYTDRAQKRRETVGSQNPHEKTKVASLDESIDKENKGFKLLAKMGWKEGQSLGKDGEGRLEPVRPVANQGTAGIGSNEAHVAVKVPNEKQSIWKKAQERFEKLPATSDAFEEDLAN